MSMNAKGQSPDPAHGAAERAKKIVRSIEPNCDPCAISFLRQHIVAEMEAYAAERSRAAVEEAHKLLKDIDNVVECPWCQKSVCIDLEIDQAKAECAATHEEMIREAVEEVHLEMAMKQAVVHGESVMLDGKPVTNEELYKQPTDYIREAKAEAYEDAISLIDTLLNSCDPSASQRTALNRAKSVIGARAAELSGNSGELGGKDKL